MDRSNVSTVLCGSVVKTWKGSLVGYDAPRLRRELEASRDYGIAKAGSARDPSGASGGASFEGTKWVGR
jgi:5-methylthioadenosine/S-adenosylhomocysteine deaminase